MIVHFTCKFCLRLSYRLDYMVKCKCVFIHWIHSFSLQNNVTLYQSGLSALKIISCFVAWKYSISIYDTRKKCIKPCVFMRYIFIYSSIFKSAFIITRCTGPYDMHAYTHIWKTTLFFDLFWLIWSIEQLFHHEWAVDTKCFRKIFIVQNEKKRFNWYVRGISLNSMELDEKRESKKYFILLQSLWMMNIHWNQQIHNLFCYHSYNVIVDWYLSFNFNIFGLSCNIFSTIIRYFELTMLYCVIPVVFTIGILHCIHLWNLHCILISRRIHRWKLSQKGMDQTFSFSKLFDIFLEYNLLDFIPEKSYLNVWNRINISIHNHSHMGHMDCGTRLQFPVQ